jgi:hypothetical protein
MSDTIEDIKEWALESFFDKDQAEALKNESLTEIIYQLWLIGDDGLDIRI